MRARSSYSRRHSRPREGRPNKRMKLTGAASRVSRGMKVLQAAPAAYPYRSADRCVTADIGPCHSDPRRNAMLVEVQVTINASKEAVWAAITNIENASETISGIEKIEVVEEPANGLVGLRWRETRMLFGKPA